MPKLYAYGFQFVLIGLALAVLYFAGGRVPRASRGRAQVLIFACLLIFTLSLTVTNFVAPSSGGFTYVGVMAAYVLLLGVTAAYSFNLIRFWITTTHIAITGAILVGVATMQQINPDFQLLPGSDTFSVEGLVRPASTTGSYLHYPLALALLLPIAFQAGVTRHRWKLAAILGTGLLITSLSRSGILILALMIILHFAIRRNVFATATGVIVSTLAVLAPIQWSSNPYISRILEAGDAGSGGNSTRIQLWSEGLSQWLEGPLFIGDKTGQITNAAANLGETGSTVVESGVLQQMLNFGLIGAALFYLTLLLPLGSIESRNSWLRAGYLAAIMQSLVYQSIEVLPYIALLALLPLMSDSVTQKEVTRCL